MMANETKSLTVRYFDEIAFLLEAIPSLHPLVRPGETVDSLPGWREWQRKPRSIIEAGGPVLVAAIGGPTGAGKSTIFSLLTGVGVPRSLKRPTSHGCAVAGPSAIMAPDTLGRLFPGWDLRPLVHPETLAEEGLESGILFYADARAGGEGELRVIFSDLPDFNAVDRTNWDKAESMIARAEVVVFMTYSEGYKDAVVIRHLQRVCRMAGSLIFLFNKTPAAGERNFSEVARELWLDLLAYTATEPSFQQRRADGRSLDLFLRESPVYAAPWTDELSLEKVRPLSEEFPPFGSAVSGLEAERVLLRNLVEIGAEGVRSCRELAGAAEKEIERQEQRVAEARETIEKAMRGVAGSHFPIGRLLANLVSEARTSRKVRFRRYLAMPSAIAGRIAGAAVGTLRRVISRDNAEIKPWQEIEREKLDQAVEALIDQWRDRFSGFDEGALHSDQCRDAAGMFRSRPLPEAPEEWDEFVRAEGRRWVEDHPWRAAALATLGDLMILGGAAAVAIDFAVAGGLGTIGITTAAGAGSAAAGVVMDAFGKLQLGNVLESADREWRRKRASELVAHLEAQLAGPLFLDRWKSRLEELHRQPLAEIKEACARLNALEREMVEWSERTDGKGEKHEGG